MKINFTKKQFKHLLDLVHLGEWTANSTRDSEQLIKEYEELYQYINSLAKDFGYEEIIQYDQKLNDYYPTQEYENQFQPIIDANDNEVFWNELSIRLAKRDLAKEAVVPRDADERFKRLIEIEERYAEEFDENGLDRLVIMKD
ncbi:hypothetical protein ORD22_13655 [Sporosarcina sp. GW1-11]|uniref:hypothetical protein n=1 Tax=Sporosarcina sp. GW1-11 TaxID=2899126 RepID=UPI00294E3A3B|nr:hypothetical protein [Sporosarcina sp. GW1-11]MDV6379261.1 hypothetical protein [Sporosarcina sp. GW1-11]